MKLLAFILCLIASVATHAEDFTVDFSKSAKFLRLGKMAKFIVEIKPGKGLKINVSAPATLSFKSSNYIFFSKPEVKNTAALLVLSSDIKGAKVGKDKLSAHLKFYLCGPDWCRKIERTLEHPIEVLASAGH